MIARLSILAALALALSGCGPSVALISTAELCQSWRHQTVSKADKLTDKTAAIAEGNNRSRPNWGCAPGENKAKDPADTWSTTVAKAL